MVAGTVIDFKRKKLTYGLVATAHKGVKRSSALKVIHPSRVIKIIIAEVVGQGSETAYLMVRKDWQR